MGKQRTGDLIYLTQSEADRLIAMEKHYQGNNPHDFPTGGKELRIPLVSGDRRHEFDLDINSKRFNVKKYTFGNRTQNTIVLVRVDLLEGGRHVNPDNREIEGPHIHRYREGFGDMWAEPLPSEFGDPNDIFEVFQRFMDYCSITTKPVFSQPFF